MKPGLLRWSPVTCGCDVIQYKDENGELSFVTQEEAQAIHEKIFKDYPDTTSNPSKNPQRPIKVCKHHEHLGATKELYDTMKGEGRILGDTLRTIFNDPSNQYSLSEEQKFLIKVIHRSISGNLQEYPEIPDKILHPSKKVSASFDGSRRLIVKASGFSDQEKGKIKSSQEAKFGAGKVEVE